MTPLGLQMPGATVPASPGAIPPAVNVNGVLTMQSAAGVLKAEREAAQRANQQAQSAPLIQGLAKHVRDFFSTAKSARETAVEPQMIEALYARRGAYTPKELGDLEAQGSSTIYMMLFSAKCRQAEALLRDVIVNTGKDKPWAIRPSPDPELPVQYTAEILAGVASEVYQAYVMGLAPSTEQIKQRLRDAKEQIAGQIMAEARSRAERMETKMEDQLEAGGWLEALDECISDLTTFKTAILCGPTTRRKPVLKWGQDGKPQVERSLVQEWDRVDPFDMYPAPWAKDLQTAPFVHRMRLSRSALNDLIGVPGYSDSAIRAVLERWDRSTLSATWSIDLQKAAAEGRDTTTATASTGLVDALRYWGSVSGQMLIDWGVPRDQIADPTKEYEAEVWVIDDQTIKAVLNPDPLGRRPYYSKSFESVPGSFWGNSMYDLMSDCVKMCNAAARAIANNMGIASGPQVVVYTDRVPTGEDITTMFPWKIWQTVSDPMGGTAKPVDFFQPESNVAPLMAIYEKFSVLADEYTGIPRYMTGTEGTPGAGRTASGLSMMIGNASKIIKQVVSGLDLYIIAPSIERLYQHNMIHSEDPDLKGDVEVVARGAMSLITKEAAQVRRNEFLQSTANPFDMQIIGMEGRAEVLRETARSLDMNTDRIVPPVSVIRQRAMVSAMQQAGQPVPQGQPAQAAQVGSGQELMNGAPVTDQFQPTPAS